MPEPTLWPVAGLWLARAARPAYLFAQRALTQGLTGVGGK